MRKLIRMSAGGDEVLKEWDEATITEQELEEIEREFNLYLYKGWFAANVQESKLLKGFDPEVETILLIPQMKGGVE